MDITGKKLFVKALLEEGVDTVFAYPGGTVRLILYCRDMNRLWCMKPKVMPVRPVKPAYAS